MLGTLAAGLSPFVAAEAAPYFASLATGAKKGREPLPF
jgi:hypothetical protein